MVEQLLEVFDCRVEKNEMTRDLEDILSGNILWDLLYHDNEVALAFLFMSHEKKDKFSFDDLTKYLKQILQKDDESIKRSVEKALDVLLDVGLASPKWGKDERNGKIIRLFSRRNEVSEKLQPYCEHLTDEISITDDVDDVSLLDEGTNLMKLFDLILALWYGPEKDFRFFRRVLDINGYLAHTADIIDPEHFRIKGIFSEPKSYTEICEALKNIANGKIYDANVKYYHIKKKLSLYNLDKLLKNEQENILNSDEKITQCKIRVLFNVCNADVENKKIYIKDFIFVPIVNFEIEENRDANNCKMSDYKFCNYCKKRSWKLCVDCLTFYFTTKLAKEFINKLKSAFDDDLEFFFDDNQRLHWSWYEYKYSPYTGLINHLESYLSETLSGLVKSNAQTRNEDGGIEKYRLYPKFIPEVVKKKIRKFENDFLDYLKEVLRYMHKNNCEILITFARKGDALINHIIEDLENELDQSDPRDYETLSKLKKVNELLSKVKRYSSNEFIYRLKNNEIKDTSKEIVLLDDAINRGKAIKEFLEDIGEDIRKNIKITAFVVNGNNIDEIKENLSENIPEDPALFKNNIITD